MTTLPKRKPARRTTMRPKSQPKPGPQPQRRLDWAALTAPLDTAPPVIITSEAREAWTQLADQLRADWGAEGIRAFNDASEAAACHATYRPCIQAELAAAASPARLPSERLFPVMMP